QRAVEFDVLTAFHVAVDRPRQPVEQNGTRHTQYAGDLFRVTDVKRNVVGGKRKDNDAADRGVGRIAEAHRALIDRHDIGHAGLRRDLMQADVAHAVPFVQVDASAIHHHEIGVYAAGHHGL